MDPVTWADILKTQGNELYKKGHYQHALVKYGEAISILSQFPFMGNFKRELALLFCNQANALFKLNQWADALLCAHSSFQSDNQHVKAYYRAGCCCLKMNENDHAVKMFITGLMIMQGTPKKEDVVEFLSEILMVVEVGTFCHFFPMAFENILRQRYDKHIWKLVIERLVKREMHQACVYLQLKLNKLPKDIIDLNVSLKPIFEKYLSSIINKDMTAIAELVTWLVSMGAKVETIGRHPLHEILKLCLQSENNNLFKLALEKKPSLKDNLNQKDENENTLLHVIALTKNSQRYTMRRQVQDIKMLLGYGCDPVVTNGDGKQVSAILRKNKNFKADEIIKKHLEKNVTSASVPTKPEEVCETAFSENLETLFVHALEQFKDFCIKTGTLLNKKTNFLKHNKVEQFLHVLSNTKEIPPELNCDIPETFVQIVLEHLILEKKWESILLLLTRNASGNTEKEYQGLLKRCHLPNINICSVLSCIQPSLAFRIPLVKLLLDQGASPNGLGEESEAPIHICLKKKDFALAYMLLSKGANPHTLTMVKGDTPLHAAIFIALNNEDDGILMLKYLLDLYSSEPENYPYLDPNKQDNDGNTLMHFLFKSDNPKQYQRVMGLLAKFDIKLTLHNKQGKDARHRIKKTDPRWIAWNEARVKHKHDPSAHPPKHLKAINGGVMQSKPQSKSTAAMQTSGKAKCDEPSLKSDMCQQASHEPVLEIVEQTKKPLTMKEKLVQAVRDAIRNVEISLLLTEPEATGSNDNVNDSMDKISELQCSPASRPQAFTNDIDEDQHGVIGAPDVCDDEQPLLCNNDDDMEVLEADLDLTNINFSNMTWEIECAPEALRKLGCKSVPQYMKNKIILSILKLGNGEWTRSLHKQLKCSKSDIKLYEVKLDKGARMLWELAIDFSPRCSEDPEKIMESEFSHSAFRKTGRVYTEIIRIWDIILDHCKLNHAIENICNSYNRGLMCVLRKKLRKITKTQVNSNVQKCIPKCFVEDVEMEQNNDHPFSDYFPPASAAETEYNIMKFHSFSTDMALNILNNLSARVEYPFRVGELEYAVIDLNPQPMEAIILIGRSGTGKTTCCMYRLWKKFHSYWERVETTGEPWIVKQTWQRRKYDDIFDSDDTEDEDMTETSESTDEEQPTPEEEYAAEEVCSQNSEEEEEESEKLEHYHPVFITKNPVLCQEVQRNFHELSKSTKVTSHFKPVEPNVFKLQNLQDENFPVFLTSQQFLLLLDASMPEPYFPRNEDGSLQYNITGWSTSDELDIPDLLREDDEGDVDMDNDEEESTCEVKESYPRVFVTFEVFANDLWPKMTKGKSPFNAALVWKEIKSFFKGSFEALKCPQGRLTEEQYFKLGKKRAPNFQGDRKELYRLFRLYEHIKSSKGYFDEEDLLYNLSCRVSKMEELPWSIHELYGDEIQDFTQAELFLLMRCINDPNSMFLTGDTAQSIMKGVSFRFSDLRSLFYYASKNCSDEKHCIVRKPKRIYQLYQNYRSHSGILFLASGVVDLLQCYFPESFDRLPRDCGLFDGPKSTVLDSCSVSDLAILLRGNQRKTQPIEFGAHQVILVKNELAKERMPEELNLALVLTIYEAKGLEFDDVLLYNFFTDSEAPKEWKIISSFNPGLHENESENNKTAVIEVPLDNLSAPSSRPSQMNPDMYKILNGELKQLYTAITRARVNLWIFDENQEKRGPAFEYFISRNFVKVVKTDENTDLDDKIFVRTSSKEEWISRGDYYAKHKYWKVAAKCYQKGGASDKEKLAFTHDTVLKLQSKKANASNKMEYIKLATTYLESGEHKLALKCLAWAKEYRLCAELCKKLEKVKEAGYFYKRIKEHKNAAQCFEQSGEFELALKLYLEENLYEEAANVVERHKEIRPEGLLSHTAKPLYLEAAADHFNNNRIKKMTEVLSKLDTEDQLLFLKRRKRWSEAAELLKSKGRCEEAAMLMRQHGKLLEAADLSRKEEFRASCLLAAARCMIAEDMDVGIILSEAKQLFKQGMNRVGLAEASLLEGIVESNFEMLNSAYKMYWPLAHNAGTVEALFHSLKCGKNEDLLFMASHGLNALVTLVKALRETKNNSEKEMVKSCLEFFGITHEDGPQCFIPQFEGARILNLFSDNNFEIKEKIKDNMYCMDIHEMKLVLERHLLKRLCEISSDLFGRVYQDICPKFIAGLDCTYENCTDFHQPLQRFQLKGILHKTVNLITISGLLLESKKHTKEFNSEIQEILNTYAFRFCSNLLQIFFPKHFHFRIISENTVACKMFTEILHRAPLSFKTMLNKYVESLFLQLDSRMKRESTDHWLQIAQIFTLSSNYPDSLINLIGEEERQYNREFYWAHEARAERKRVKMLDGKYGMLQPDTADESLRGTHIHFFRLLDGALSQLYINKNPDECKRYFYRFMNLLVKKCIEPLIPNIGNTVMLLEWQFILCSAVLIRFESHTRVILPKSYISIIHHWDFMFRRKVNTGVFKDTYSILWDFRPKDVKQTTWRFRRQISYLAAVLCGEAKQEFNVLLDAFSDIDYISSGEAERSIVLCLVMMINVKGVVFPKEENILLQHFPMIQNKLKKMKEDFPSRVSERLINVVDQVATANNVEEVVNVLQDLLDQRDSERLVECSWRWDTNYRGGQVRGIYFEDKFNFKKFDRVQHNASELKYSNVDNEDFKYTHADNDEDDFHDKVDLVADLAAQVQQKQSVKQRFHELILLVCCCIKWKRAYRRIKNKQIEETIPDMFKKANVDRTQCDLCGVKFSHGPSFPAQIEDPEECATEDVTTSMSNVEENENLSKDLQLITESYENHITTEAHKFQSTAYNNYLQFYKVNVDLVVCEGKSLMHTAEQTSRDHQTSKEEFHLEHKKIESKIKGIVDLMDEIYKKKSWSEAETLMENPVEELTTIILAVKNLLEKSEKQMTMPEGTKQEDMFEYEIDCGGFEELLNKKSKRNKKRMKKKN